MTGPRFQRLHDGITRDSHHSMDGHDNVTLRVKTDDLPQFLHMNRLSDIATNILVHENQTKFRGICTQPVSFHATFSGKGNLVRQKGQASQTREDDFILGERG